MAASRTWCVTARGDVGQINAGFGAAHRDAQLVGGLPTREIARAYLAREAKSHNGSFEQSGPSTTSERLDKPSWDSGGSFPTANATRSRSVTACAACIRIDADLWSSAALRGGRVSLSRWVISWPQIKSQVEGLAWVCPNAW